MARPPLRSIPGARAPSDEDEAAPAELVDERMEWPGTSLFPQDTYPGFAPDKYPATARIERFDGGEWVSFAHDFAPLEVTEDFLRDTWGPGKYKVTLWNDGGKRRSASRTVKLVGGKRRRFPGEYRSDEEGDEEGDETPRTQGTTAPSRTAPLPLEPPPVRRTQLPDTEAPSPEGLAMLGGVGTAVVAVRELAPLLFRALEHFELRAAQRLTVDREYLASLSARLESHSRMQTEIVVALLQSGQAQNTAMTTASLGLAQGIVTAAPNAALSRAATTAQESAAKKQESAVEIFLKGAKWAVEQADGGDGDSQSEGEIMGVPVEKFGKAGHELMEAFSGWLRSKSAPTTTTPGVAAPPPPPPPPPATVAAPAGAPSLSFSAQDLPPGPGGE